jgi:hypothetical protein
MVRNLSEGQYPRNTDTGNMNDDDGLLKWRGLLSLPSHGCYKHRYRAASEIYIINENYGKQGIFLFGEE